MKRNQKKWLAAMLVGSALIVFSVMLGSDQALAALAPITGGSLNNSALQIGVDRGSAGINADREAEPGDLVLFPSYLYHEVPRNQGEQRITIAFNAIPDRLDCWGYRINFAP